MKTLYLDIFSGISGDMFIGALIDLGIDARQLERELQKLGLDGYHLHVRRDQKSSISGTKFDVHLDEDHHHDEHEHEHGHGDLVHSHPHSHSHGHKAQPEHEHVAHGNHGGPLVQTSLGTFELTVLETNVPPRFRLYLQSGTGRKAASLPNAGVTIETVRPDGKRQLFKFKRSHNYLEATTELREP